MKRVAFLLDDYPEHAEIIGDILLGYTDLEFFMTDLVGGALGDADINNAVRVLYRLRGANDRLNVADALLRPFMEYLKLLGPYCQWLGAMRRCKMIRNQYAHCGWCPGDDGRLTFVDLEEAGQIVEGKTTRIPFYPIELGLLKEQQAFFSYTIDLTVWLMAETRYRQDRRRKHDERLPKSRAVPKLHSPLD